MEETQRLKDQVEKARAEVEKAKAEVKRVRNEAEQHGYDVGVAEIEDALRDASSELRRPENVFFPPAIQAPGSASGQKDVAPSVTKSFEDAQLQNPPHPVSRSRPKNLKLHSVPPRKK